MRDFILIRLAAFAATVLGAALVLFVVLDLLPGSGAALPLQDRALSLFGSADTWQRLAITLPLTLGALAVAGIGGFALHRLPLPGLRSATAVVLAVIPPFWLGMMLALLGLFVLRMPPSGFIPWSNPLGAVGSLLVPALALGIPYAGSIALGLERHDGVAPATLLGRTFVALVIAATVVEAVFYMPGLGGLVLGAAQQHDLMVLRGGLFVLVLVAATGILIAALSRIVFEAELQRW